MGKTKFTLCEKLHKRKELIYQKNVVTDVMFTMAMTGFILMVVETELYLRMMIKKSGLPSLLIKSIISGTTIILLITICMSYYIGAQIRALDAGIKNLNFVMSVSKWSFLFLELLLCSFHPFPGTFKVYHEDIKGKQLKVSVDAVLSFLMIARLYLIGRFAAVHSWLMTKHFLHCIGAISKVKINTIFYVKAMMWRYPVLCLIFIMMISLLVNTWAMRACRLYHEADDHVTYLGAMWMVVASFLTLGYGDSYPKSHCRRYISVCSALLGVLSTALLVVIIWKRLERTRKEEYVFNFVSRIQVNSKRKKAAANLIKYALLMWMSKTHQKHPTSKITKIKDGLNRSLKEVRETKRDMEEINDDIVGVVDVYHLTEKIYDSIHVDLKRHDSIVKRMQKLDERLKVVENKLEKIYTALSK